jgi:DNA-binding MarR family transcriptional regulator
MAGREAGMRDGAVEADPGERGDGRRLLSAIRGLVRRFSVSERADVSCCGVTVAQAATLETLRMEGTMRLSDLGRRLGITPSTLTRNLARLEEGGLVSRDADGTDGRAFRVGLTAAGRRAAERLERQEEAFAREILARLPEGRRAHVVEAVGDLLGAVREATADCCPEAFTHLMEGFPRGSSRREGGRDERRGCGGGTC